VLEARTKTSIHPERSAFSGVGKARLFIDETASYDDRSTKLFLPKLAKQQTSPASLSYGVVDNPRKEQMSSHLVTVEPLDAPQLEQSDPLKLESIHNLTHDLALESTGQLTITGSSTLDRMGEHITSCDINRDGSDDVVIGVHLGDGVGDSGGGTDNRGEVHVVFGTDPMQGTRNVPADWVIYGSEAGDNAGYSVACGDVNNDGHGDIVLGAPFADGSGNARQDSGEIYVIFGSTDANRTINLPSDADWVMYGSSSEDQAGFSLTVSNVDGTDGDDILIGAPFADGSGDGRVDGGEVYMVSGQSTASRTLDLRTQSDVTIYGAQADDQAGSGVAAGDVNGDGVSDVLIGSRYGDGPGDTRNNAGEVSLVLGRSSFASSYDLSTQADWLMYGIDSDDWIGEVLSSGDLNGDGYDDILIGTPYADGPSNARADAGEIYAVLGRNSLLLVVDLASQADLTVYGAEADDRAGQSLWAGDVTNNHKADIVIGAENAAGPSNSRPASGETYVISGQSDIAGDWDLADGAYITIHGAQAGDASGVGVGGGDFDGDGNTDMMIGAWQVNLGSRIGNVYTLIIPRADIRLVTTPVANPDNLVSGNGSRANFTIKNFGDVEGSVENLSMQIEEGGITYQYPKVDTVTLAPGESYTYQETRRLFKTGTYQGEAGYEASPWHELDVTDGVTNQADFQVDPLDNQPRQRFKGKVPWCGEAGEPVNTAVGNFYHTDTDIVVPGAGRDLRLERTYNTLDAPQDGPFGFGWTFNHDIFLSEESDGTMIALMEDGKYASFASDGSGNYIAQESVFDTLAQTTDAYVMTRKDQSEYLFDHEGRLKRITDQDGLSTDLEYETGLLTVLTDTAGLTYTFSYTGVHVSRIQSSAGISLTYTYNISGELTHITDAEGGVHSYTYDSEHRLLTMTDPDGRTFVRNVYDDQGRVIEQFDGFGERIGTFAYDNGGGTHTVFADNQGVPITYTYDTESRLVSQQDAVGNTMSYTYDDDNNMLSKTDRRGNTTSYTYDDQGNLTSETDPEGHTWQYTYDTHNNLLSETDPLGNTTTFVYDEEDHLVRKTDPLGYSTEYTYDEMGLPITVKDKNGNVTTQEYNSLGLPTVITDTLGGVTYYTYDQRGNKLSMTDAEGRTAWYQYDQENRLTVITDALGFTRSLMYDDLGHLVREVNRRGDEKTYVFDENENIIQETDWSGHVYTSTYDMQTRLIASTDPLGQTITYTYDDAGRIIQTTDKRGNATHFTYDENSNLLSETDALGNVTRFEYDTRNRQTRAIQPCETCTEQRVFETHYDALGRVVEEIDPEGHRTRYAYDAMGQTLAVTDALGFVTKFTYDGNGNLLSETDALGNETTYTYNAVNRLVSISDCTGERTIVYDLVGNVLSETDQSGRTTTYTYDANDRVTTITNPLGGVTSLTYDAEGNVLTRTDPLGYTIVRTYDPNGNMTTEQDRRGHITSYTYDALNRLIETTNAAGGKNILTYDANDNLLSETNAEDYTISYRYDAANRLIQETDALGNVVSFAHDDAGRVISMTDALDNVWFSTYDKNGNLLTETDPQGNITRYEYDALNRQVLRIDALEGEWSTTYDALGRVTQVQDPRGYHTDSVYDCAGHKVKEVDAAGNETLFAYDAVGNLISRTDRNGHATSWQYDDLNRRVHQEDELAGVTIWEYDAVGNMLALTDPLSREMTFSYDEHGNLLTATNALDETTSYTYDVLNREIAQTDPNGNTTTREYDQVGNVVKTILAGGQESVATFDGNGNRISVTDPGGETTTYTYDALNRLVSETDPNGSTTEYGYDASGNRISEQDAEENTTSFAYDTLDRLIRTTDALGQEYRYHYDAVGNTTDITDTAGHTVSFGYDELNRLRTETNALGRTVTSDYDSEGNIIQRTDARGLSTDYTYDELNRLVKVTYADLVPAVLPEPTAQFSVTQDPSRDNNATRVIVDATDSSDEEDSPEALQVRWDWENDGVYDTSLSKTRVTSHTYAVTGEYTIRLEVWNTMGLTNTVAHTVSVLSDTEPEPENTAPVARCSVAPNQGDTTTRFTFDASSSSDAEDPPEALQVRWDWEDNQTYDTVFTTTKRILREDMLAGTHNVRLQVRDTEGMTSTDLCSVSVSSGDSSLYLPIIVKSSSPDMGTSLQAEPVQNPTRSQTAISLPTTPETAANTSSPTAQLPGMRAGLMATPIPLPVSQVQSPSPGAARPMTQGSGQPPIQPSMQMMPRSDQSDWSLSGNVPSGGDYAPGPGMDYASPQTTPVAETPDSSLSSSMPMLQRAMPVALSIEEEGTAGVYTTTQTIEYTYDAVGNRTTMRDATGTTTYTYDQADRLISQTDPQGQQISFAYDGVGNRTGVTFSNGETVSYGYNENNWLTSVTDAAGNTTTIAYTDVGLERTVTYPNGASVSYEYDAASRLEQVTNRTTEGVTARYSYTLDDVGNKLSSTETYAGTQGTINETYSYDKLYRLTGSTSSDGTKHTYTYDVVGNRLTWNGTRQTTDGLEAFSIEYTYDANNQLLATRDSTYGTTTYAYDLAGNRIREQSNNYLKRYSYDGQNRLRIALVREGTNGLLSYREGVREVMTYDGLGRRVIKTGFDVESDKIVRQRVYTYEGFSWNTLEEDQLDGSVRYTYRDAGQKVAFITSDSTHYVHTDSLGSTVGSSDSSGVLDSSTVARYTDFGEVQEGAEALLTSYSFTGHERDSYTGLIYGKNRYYDPQTGLWLTKDTFRGTLRDPQSLHRYTYVQNNPLRYVDPDGRAFWDTIKQGANWVGQKLNEGVQWAKETVSNIFNPPPPPKPVEPILLTPTPISNPTPSYSTTPTPQWQPISTTSGSSYIRPVALIGPTPSLPPTPTPTAPPAPFSTYSSGSVSDDVAATYNQERMSSLIAQSCTVPSSDFQYPDILPITGSDEEQDPRLPDLDMNVLDPIIEFYDGKDVIKIGGIFPTGIPVNPATEMAACVFDPLPDLTKMDPLDVTTAAEGPLRSLKKTGKLGKLYIPAPLRLAYCLATQQKTKTVYAPGPEWDNPTSAPTSGIESVPTVDYGLPKIHIVTPTPTVDRSHQLPILY